MRPPPNSSDEPMPIEKRPTTPPGDDTSEVNLSIEDTGISLARAKPRPGKATRAFDPYGGALANKPPSRKKDLRKLGAWLEAKQRAADLKRQEAGSEPEPGAPKPGKRSS
jgi:hypothetical protein